jgi:thiol-disulfide isomerase/thioredoxin
MPTVAAGKTAPPFDLASMDGKGYSLRDALAQGPVLAAFFKVSCPTCQYTFPFLERLYQQFRAQNVQLWGISQDTARDSQRFAKTYGVTFPILIDEEPYETGIRPLAFSHRSGRPGADFERWLLKSRPARNTNAPRPTLFRGASVLVLARRKNTRI